MNNRLKIGIMLTLLVMAGPVFLKAQDTLLVKGVVRSTGNRPVANVAVSIEGSVLLPVVTDSTGTFEIPSTSGKEWLIFDPAGDFKERRISLNKRDELTVYLTPSDLPSGDDPMKVLSTLVPRKDVVPSHADLYISDLHHTSALSVDQHMQGRLPGMLVTDRSGMPGSGAVTTVRGISSIHASNEPLYMVDGIPLVSHGLFGSNLAGYVYNGLMGINPFDISSTTLYKDPGVGAVLGGKGSNGVIVVETLDPSATQTSIEVNMRAGYSQAPDNQIPQLDAVQHNTLMNEVLFSSGYHEEELREFVPTLFMEEDDPRYIDYQHNTNWQDYIFSNASMYNMNIKVKGGDEIARYGLSFGYLNSNGIIRSTGFSGYNLRFVSRLNIFTWLKMDAGVSLNTNKSILKDAALVKETSPILTALAKSPMLNAYQYDYEGNELTALSEVDEIGVSNPLATIENYEAYNNNYNFTSFVGLEGTVSRDFSVISRFSFTYDVMKEKIFMPNLGMEPYYNFEAYNVSKATNNDLTSIYNNTYLRYHKAFGTDHQLSSNTGFYLMNNKYQLDWGLTKNAHENDEYRNLDNGQPNLREIGGDNRIWNWVSFYEHLTYGYRDRYFLNASISVDGSSRVGDNAANTVSLGGLPFGLFYSAGVAWRISGEPFLRDLGWLEDLRIRFNYGKTGNDDIGESSAHRWYHAIKYRQTVGLYPAVLDNDRLTYETETMLSAGVNLSLLGNRIRIDVDRYKSTTDDMIIFTPVNAYFGYDYLVENGGTMENRGWELGAFLRLIDTRNFKWDVSAYLSTIENQVVDIKGDKLVYTVPGAERVNQNGYPVNSFYGYIYEGVFSTQAEADEAAMVNNRGIPFNAGDARYADLSGPEGRPDSVINEYDKTIIGDAIPDLFAGFSTSVSYRGFKLSAAIQYVTGHELFNYVRYKNESMTGLENQSQHVLNRWQYDGHETDVPRALYEDPVGNSAFSTRWIEDGTYLRLKYVKVSYTSPSQFLVFKNAEFFISVNNLFTVTDYLGYDPEFAYSFSQMHQGIDYGMTPHPRQYILGVTFGL